MTGRVNLTTHLVTAFVWLYLPGIAAAVERHVPSQYTTIQGAINAAVNGDTVIVAPGTYTGTGNRDIDFLGKAITVRSTDPNKPGIVAATIINCQGTKADPHRGFYFHSGENAGSVLNGLTITNGYVMDGCGGGVRCNSSSPAITNCTFVGNSAIIGKYGSLGPGYGGGMYNSSSSPAVTNCAFIGNSVSANVGYGGGMYNTSSSSPTLTNCAFGGNSAPFGGGMCNRENSNPTLTNCTFSSNSASTGGGMNNSFSSPTITNCAFAGNFAPDGGGMYNASSGNPTITNCTFSNNSAYQGGGMENSSSNPTITNCTFSGNSASNSGGGMTNYSSNPTLANCILWGNTATNGSQIFNSSSTPTVSFSDVQGGWAGTGNINANPLFVNAAGGDLHLLPNSPCINAGDPNSDFGLEPEPDGGRIDMGAYGNTPEATSKYGLVLQSYNLVSRTRVGRTVFDYVYKMTLNNNSNVAVSSVHVELLNAPDNVSIIDNNVTFAYIEAGRSAISDDTFTLRVDRSIPIDPTIISWRASINWADGTSTQQIQTTSIPLEILVGDITGDKIVNLDDLVVLVNQWLQLPGSPSADIAPLPTGDNIVNFLDFALLAQNWLK
jgi:hypothetical protein